MSYSVVFASVVLTDDVPTIDTMILERVRASIETKLTQRPETFGKPLRHSLRNHRSLRVGDFRVVYRIDKSVIRIVAIRHRRVAYQVAEKRVS
jgi:mRNA interferase RelE/StbE